MPDYLDDCTLFARLRAANGDAWHDYIEHDFVRRLAEGSLPDACFRHYLEQDYLFLIHFARAYALAVYKSDNLADMRVAAAGMSAILDTEMALHVDYCRGWGLDEATIANLPEATATMAYTRYVLEAGLQGDLLDLYVALAPCVLGYGEIGARLIAVPAMLRDGSAYGAWIDMYGGAEYQEVAHAHGTVLDRLWTLRAGEGRFDSLARIFGQATRLEAGFWQMGIDCAG